MPSTGATCPISLDAASGPQGPRPEAPRAACARWGHQAGRPGPKHPAQRWGKRCPATAGVDGVSVSRLAGYSPWRISAGAAKLFASAPADACQCNLAACGGECVALSRRCTPATAGDSRSALVVLIRGHCDRRGSQQILVELSRPILARNEQRHACGLEPPVNCEEQTQSSGMLEDSADVVQPGWLELLVEGRGCCEGR